MVVIRKISKRKYILAALLTLMMFALGITLGMVLDNERFRWIEEANNAQKVDYQSLQFQYVYLTQIKDTKNNCKVLQIALRDAITDLSKSLEQFKQYKEKSLRELDNKEIIQRRYLLDNLRYWLFFQEIRQSCTEIDKVPILYFYSENDCDSCINQGIIMTHFKKVFKDKVLIFPINIDLRENEAMVEILINTYDVTRYPTLVIEDEKYEGYIGKTNLANVICSNFRSEQQECANKIFNTEIDDNENFYK